ncbi:MAG: exonuclease domain-containing protein [candidate division Zixibacteria bacterium]
MIDKDTIFIAFDTETTGLTASDGRIVEIAALKFDFHENEIARFSELVNPGMKIPTAAMNVHHISDEEVADKPMIDIILPKFLDFIGNDKSVLIAQNAIFDIGFVNHEALRNDIKLPGNTILDQIDLTRKAHPNLISYSLEKICRLFNLVDTQTHRAMADAVLVKRLFFHCLKKWIAIDDKALILNELYHYSFGGPMIVKINQGLLDIIETALDKGAKLEIVYDGGSMRKTPRQIIPVVMYNRDGVMFLTAQCLVSNTKKQFRVDRIKQCEIVK